MNDKAEGLTEPQKDKMLVDMYHALVGDPLNPGDKPGLAALVERHNYTLYGKTGRNGLVGDNARFKRIVWIGAGVVIALKIGGWAIEAIGLYNH